MNIVQYSLILILVSMGCLVTNNDGAGEQPVLRTQVETTPDLIGIDVNPASKVLVLGDIENYQFYDVVQSRYYDLELLKEAGMSIETYQGFKEWGFIDSYAVSYAENIDRTRDEGIELKIRGVQNSIGRFDSKESLRKRMDFVEEGINASFLVQGRLSGKNFGDKTLYADGFPILGGLKSYWAHVQVENFYIELYLEFNEEGELSDMYPYIETLVNRVTSDQIVQPPPIS